jgi:hypothetical protein
MHDECAHSPRRAWLSLHWAISGREDPGQARGPVFTPDPRVTAPFQVDAQIRVVNRGQRGGSPSSDVVGTSPSPVSLAEHRVLFGVGQELPDLLRTAAGHGDLGSPRQRLLA